jgi:hypothetical protein
VTQKTASSKFLSDLTNGMTIMSGIGRELCYRSGEACTLST